MPIATLILNISLVYHESVDMFRMDFGQYAWDTNDEWTRGDNREGR